MTQSFFAFSKRSPTKYETDAPAIARTFPKTMLPARGVATGNTLNVGAATRP